MAIRLTRMSAKDLMNVNHVRTMNPYVSVTLSGAEQRTPIDKKGGTSPHWAHPLDFIVDELAALTGDLALEFKIMTTKSFRGDKEVGRVTVPVKELVEQQGDGRPKRMSYSVTLPSGGTQGVLEFFYQFVEINAAPYALPEGNGHTPQGYGHPPNAAPGYGFPSQQVGAPPLGHGHYPPAASQEPPRRSVMLGDVLRGTMLMNVISDAAEGFDV